MEDFDSQKEIQCEEYFYELTKMMLTEIKCEKISITTGPFSILNKKQLSDFNSVFFPGVEQLIQKKKQSKKSVYTSQEEFFYENDSPVKNIGLLMLKKNDVFVSYQINRIVKQQTMKDTKSIN